MKYTIVLILTFLTHAASAVELKSIKEKDITYLLNNFVVIGESGHKAPAHAHIITVTEPFECGGPWQNYPSSKLYVATSMIALDPPQKVYILHNMCHCISKQENALINMAKKITSQFRLYEQRTCWDSQTAEIDY